VKNVLIVLLLLVVGYGVWERADLAEKLVVLERQKQAVDTLYLTDTLTLTKVRRITDSVLSVDTVIHTDTVRLMIAAEREACGEVIQTCEERVAIRDEMIRVLKKKPSVWSKVPWVAAGVLGGVILSR
jgi:hypothetical protein